MPNFKRPFNLYTFVLDISNLAFVKNVLDMLLVFKEFPLTKDPPRKNLTMLVLMNCAGEDDIQVLTPNPIPMKGELIMDILKDKKSDSKHSADWLLSVNKAIELVERAQTRKDIQTYYIIVISPLKTPCYTDWGPPARIMKSRDIKFIVCINEHVIYNMSDPIRYFLSLRTANEYVQISGMNSNIEKAQKIANYTFGAVTSPKYFLDFVAYMDRQSEMQAWVIRLHLGNYMFPTLVSQVFYSKSNVTQKKERTFVNCQRLSATGSLVVDQYGASVDKAKTFRAGNYFGRTVVFPEELSPFKCREKWTFRVHSFIKKTDLPDVCFGNCECYAVTADQRSQRAGHFVELVDRLLIKGMYAIVQFKMPHMLYVLAPKTGGWMLMTPLNPRTRRRRRRNFLPISKKSSDVLPYIPDSSSMIKCRSYLLNKGKCLFYPQCSLGLDTHIALDDMRRNIGFNDSGYKQEVPYRMDSNREMDVVLMKDFGNICFGDFSIPENTNFVAEVQIACLITE